MKWDALCTPKGMGVSTFGICTSLTWHYAVDKYGGSSTIETHYAILFFVPSTSPTVIFFVPKELISHILHEQAFVSLSSLLRMVLDGKLRTG